MEAEERMERCILISGGGRRAGEEGVGVGVGMRRGSSEMLVRDCWMSAMRLSRRIWMRLYMGGGTLLARWRLFTWGAVGQLLLG